MAKTTTRSPWTPEDRALMVARRVYLDSLCPGGCGQPHDEAHHEDNDGWYSVHEELKCYACQARDQWQREREKSKHPLEAGVIPQLMLDRDYAEKPLPPLPLAQPEKRRGPA